MNSFFDLVSKVKIYCDLTLSAHECAGITFIREKIRKENVSRFLTTLVFIIVCVGTAHPSKKRISDFGLLVQKIEKQRFFGDSRFEEGR
jgi:hypothetical protein